MAWARRLRAKLPEKALDVMVAALGFWIALGINSAIDARHDRAAYQAIVMSIRSEATSNQVVLQDSFEMFYRDGVVLRHFSLTAATQAMGNSTFTREAEGETLEALNEYIRTLMLANSYADAAQILNYFPNKQNSRWLESILLVWPKNLEDSRVQIERIQHLGNGLMR